MSKTLTATVLLALSVPLLAQGLPRAAVETGRVRREVVKERVTGIATVEPWRRTVLSAEIAGLVKEYPLREGNPVVAKKTVVCELKTDTLEIDLAEAEALLARAKAEAANSVDTAKATMEEKRALHDRARSDLERSEKLLAKEVINQAEYDRAAADEISARFQLERALVDYELAESGADPASQALVAEVRRAEARLARVEDQIAKATIRSPVTGLVVRRLTEVGSWVTPGSPIIEIIKLDPALVRVGVNERHLPKLAIGDDAVVTLDALPGRTFTGKIRFIVPEANPRSRSFPVLIEIENKRTELKAGMFARVVITAGEGREALTAPKDAVVFGPRGAHVCTIVPMVDPETGRPVVDEKSGRPALTWRAHPVRVGLAVGDRFVVEGETLTDGLEIITTGNEKLIPGQPIIPPGKRPPGGGGEPGEGGR